MKDNTVDAEIVEDEFKAPVLKDIKYPINQTDIDALLNEYAEIPTIDPEADSEIVAKQFEFVLTGHKKFVKARTTIEKIRKELKAPSMEYGKKVDDIAKEFQKKINGVETALLIQRKVVEDNEARKQREAEEAEEARIEAIKANIKTIANQPLEYINKSSKEILEALTDGKIPTVENFQEFFDAAIGIYKNTQMRLQVMFDNTVKSEKADELIAEQEKVAREAAEQKEAEQKEQQDKIDKEREEFEEEKRKFAQQQQDIQDEADRKQAEREADELLKKQAAEKENRDREERKHMKELYDEAISDLTDLEYKNVNDILEAIIDGEIRHIKWSPDGN